MSQWIGTLAQVTACRLFGSISLPKTILTVKLAFRNKFYRHFHHNEAIRFKIRHLKISLRWRHERDGVLNPQPHDCLLRRRSKKSSELRVTGLCEGNSLLTSEFPAQRASNAENLSIWWRHHVVCKIAIILFRPSISINIHISHSKSRMDVVSNYMPEGDKKCRDK